MLLCEGFCTYVFAKKSFCLKGQNKKKDPIIHLFVSHKKMQQSLVSNATLFVFYSGQE